MKYFFSQTGRASFCLICMACVQACIVLLVSSFSAHAQSQGGIHLDLLGRYSTGIVGQSASEIVAYDTIKQRLFFTTNVARKVSVLSLANPAAPTLLFSIDLSAFGAKVNSVAVKNGIVAIAVENTTKTSPGHVVFCNTDGAILNQVTVGSLPDMVTFTPDGTKVLVANEAEPNDAYTIDPEGSISIIDISGGIAGLTQANVLTAGFTAFNGTTLDPSVRIFGPNATVAQDLEPEYITISDDSKTAWVTLQENNAIAIVDIPTATVKAIKGLGFKDYNLAGNGLDASDKDNKINIQNWPIKGMYQPDGITHFTVNGQTYLVSANEGDTRAYTGFNEEARVSSLTLDPVAFPNASTLKNNANLGRLKVTNALGDANHDGKYEELYSFGARSFSIWSTTGTLVYDSGDQFERITASVYPNDFNSDNDGNQSFDTRSDDKGPEPEGVAVGTIGDSIYAFVGLERISGLMVFNITNPTAAHFVQYINTRNFAATSINLAGDVSAEEVMFIPKSQSPNKRDLVVVANEVSGTVTIFQATPYINPASDVKLKRFQLRNTPLIGTYNGMQFFEGGASGLDFIEGTTNEFWYVTDRGVNADATNNPKAGGKDTKVFPFPNYTPKIFRVRAEGDSLKILQITTLKRPDGTDVTGLPNPVGFGNAGEVAWADTIPTLLGTDFWGIDSEGITEGNNNDLWICEEYGAGIWNVNKTTGQVINRYWPFAAQPNNVSIPGAFSTRRPNRGFEGVTVAPNGKVYAIIQSGMYNPDKNAGNTRLHRILEIDPQTNAMRMFAYEHDPEIGDIKNPDWKIGDMAAVNNNEFLVIEHTEKNGWNYKNIYKIDISNATPITKENFNGKTFEQLLDGATAIANGVIPVTKTLFFDLLENNWDLTHDKPEGLTIINDTTFALINDNDYGIDVPNTDGVILKSNKTTTLDMYTVPQSRKLNYVSPKRMVANNVDFGRIGQPVRVNVPFRNVSNKEAITVTNTVASGNVGSFGVFVPTTTTPASLTNTIATNGTQSVDVVFGIQGASNAGRQTANWALQHTGTNSPLNFTTTGYYARLVALNGTTDVSGVSSKFAFGDVRLDAVGGAGILAKALNIGPDSALSVSAPMMVNSVSITGPDAALFSINSGLSSGTTLTSASNVSLRFNGEGQTPGVKRAVLTVSHSGANGPVTVVNLEARVGRSLLGAPTMVVIPSVQQNQTYTTPYQNVRLIPLQEGGFGNVDFYTTPVLSGTDAAMMEVVSNSGKSFLTGAYDVNNNAIIGGDGDIANAANWLSASPSSPATITATRPLFLVVRMKQPGAAVKGFYNATITLSDGFNTNAQNNLTATLIGEITGDPNLAPSQLGFGTVSIGTTLSKFISLQSTVAGTATLSIPAASPYSFAGNVKSRTVALSGNNAPVSVEVQFTPVANGVASSLLTVSGVVSRSITLTGTGQIPSVASIQVFVDQTEIADNGMVNFGNVVIGQTATKNLVIINNNAGPVTIDMISRAGTNPTQFTVGTPVSMTIAANGSLSIPVTFVPTSTSPSSGKNALVNISFTNGLGSRSIGLAGTATTTGGASSTLVLTPTAWNFGTNSGTKVFVLTNNRSVATTLSGAFITAGTSNFSIVDASGSFPRTLAANGGSTSVTVQYMHTGNPITGSVLFYTPEVSIYPSATLAGGNFVKATPGAVDEPQTGEYTQSALVLDGNYPNPFGEATDIRYSLAQPMNNVTIKIYSSMGTLLGTVEQGAQLAGNYAVHFTAQTLSSGEYYYTISADGMLQRGMMTIIR